MYTCGPTVYAIPHIGNYRSFIVSDLIRRYLEYKGYRVRHIMNITDIDDKTIRGSAKENLSLEEFTEKYTKEFFNGLKILKIKRAFKYPRATENVDEMIKITKDLIKKGYAYVKFGSVYYDISKFKDYGKLSKVDLSKIKVGARVDVDEYAKDSPQDFALMKRSTTQELRRGIYYKTEWGNVRPGWHIECSAISMRSLGKHFDIHTGGVDLIFPHHENEIAQSETYAGKKFVNYWLHFEHLIVEGQKMSKSLGNLYTLRDLLNRDYDPTSIRYVLLATHYRQQLNFTFKGLEAAKNSVERLIEFVDKLQEVKEKIYNKEISNLVKKTKEKFELAMDDDLNIPKALSAIFNLVKQVNKLIEKNKIGKKNAKEIYNLMKKFDKVLGILEYKKEKLTKEIKKLILERGKARKAGDFEKSDKIRAKLKKLGIILEDTPEGLKVKFRK